MHVCYPGNVMQALLERLELERVAGVRALVRAFRPGRWKYNSFVGTHPMVSETLVVGYSRK